MDPAAVPAKPQGAKVVLGDARKDERAARSATPGKPYGAISVKPQGAKPQAPISAKGQSAKSAAPSAAKSPAPRGGPTRSRAR